jgi:hypothetical protein
MQPSSRKTAASNPHHAHHFHKIDPMRLKQEQGGWNARARVGEKGQPQPAVNLFFVPDDEAPLIPNG